MEYTGHIQKLNRLFPGVKFKLSKPVHGWQLTHVINNKREVLAVFSDLMEADCHLSGMIMAFELRKFRNQLPVSIENTRAYAKRLVEGEGIKEPKGLLGWDGKS